jgi:hypothetical protein
MYKGMKTFPVLALSLSLTVTTFAHDWSTLQSCEEELTEAWASLPALTQDRIRSDERAWIKQKDALKGAAKMEAVKKRVEALWDLSQQIKWEDQAEADTKAQATPAPTPEPTPAPAVQHPRAALLYRLSYANTTPEHAAQLQQLYYSEMACDNATRTATDANAIQQAHAAVNANILAICQWLDFGVNDTLLWNNMFLYRPMGGGTYGWLLH